MTNDNPVSDILVELQAYSEMLELLPQMPDEATALRFFQAIERRKASLMARIESLTVLILSAPIDENLTIQDEEA